MEVRKVKVIKNLKFTSGAFVPKGTLGYFLFNGEKPYSESIMIEVRINGFMTPCSVNQDQIKIL